MRGIIPASIEAIVKDLKEISWEQVIFEAITNSLQANATVIDINFILQEELELNTLKAISQVSIADNGDGFTPENLASFQEYRSSFKKTLGCKGVGRFLYLKIFDNVNIKSLNKEINFVISKDIQIKENTEVMKNTVLCLNNPNVKIIVNYDDLKQKIRDHFIAYFKLLKDKEVVINLYENADKKLTLKSTEIPSFESKIFTIRSHQFTLNYVLDDTTISIYDGFYCAGNRVVICNSHLDPKKKLHTIKNLNILFLLSGEYLDTNVNETRDDFNIYPVRKSQELYDNLSWIEIQEELVKQIKLIAKEKGIDIDAKAIEYLTEARASAPYLAYYLQNNYKLLDSAALIREAKKQLEADKNRLRASENFDESMLGIVTQAELAEYIYDRQKIIDKIKRLTEENAIEKEIHNLFMMQYTSDETQDYRKNNLWLFDDRFMTYDKVFSEAQLNQIFPDLPDVAKRPDILSIISNTFEEKEITDIVIIELKRPDETIDPAGAETQLLRYARYINDAREHNKIRVWTYAFLKFNKETEFDLDNKSYNKIPTQGGFPIYYKYHEKPNTIINFIDYKSLAFDADTRNQTFLKILNGNSITKDNLTNDKKKI